MKYTYLNSFCNRTILVLILSLLGVANAQTDGSQLWFTRQHLAECNQSIQPKGIVVYGKGSALKVAEKEMVEGMNHLFQSDLKILKKDQPGCCILSLSDHSDLGQIITPDEKVKIGDDGFIIRYWPEKKCVLISGNTRLAVLYGVFHMLRLLQTEEVNFKQLNIVVSGKPYDLEFIRMAVYDFDGALADRAC